MEKIVIAQKGRDATPWGFLLAPTYLNFPKHCFPGRAYLPLYTFTHIQKYQTGF